MEKRMLIVDDEQNMADTLTDFFRARGFEAETAYSGQEAVDKIRKTFFQIILSDVRMPGVSGTEVLKEALKLHPDSKVIMITGYDDEETRKACVDAGAFAYLQKPLNFRELVELINKI